MIVLGIETSCDETSAALYDGSELMANVVNTQEIHRKYGGVVPELASREHLRCIVPVVQEALNLAELSWNEVDSIAVTNGPGLAGCLLMGISFAKAAAFAHTIPITPVNHIEAHLWAPLFEFPDFEPPFIGLIISGGHTQLWLVRDFGDYALIGQTLDDAVGETFDKAAQMLDLGYPGGPEIDRLSQSGDPEYHLFPRPASKSENFNFSFSGLKTSVLYFLEGLSPEEIKRHRADIAASFQKAVIDTLTDKTIRAAEKYGIRKVALGGGVAANKGLRSYLSSTAEKHEISLYIPSPQYCTDNAAMIALVGFRQLLQERSADMRFSAEPSLKLFHNDSKADSI